MSRQGSESEWSRRDFMRGGSFAAAMTLMGGIELVAQSSLPGAGSAAHGESGANDVLKCGVVGLGRRGREITTMLSRLPNVKVKALCDDYPRSLQRGKRLAPEAELFDGFDQLLAKADVQGVVVATPSYLHRDLVVKALAAGKHVYCEAPLATSVEDAATMARAAQAAAPRLVFRAGLQGRSDPQRQLVASFFRAGLLGQMVMVRAQWHKKQSWRQAAASAERKAAVNWRLDAQRSLGLPGEVGIHLVDAANWFLRDRPLAVSGQAQMRCWGGDGREVPDTVQLALEYSGGVRWQGSCTLASSFDGEGEWYVGTDATVVFRGNRAWMFRELDAPALEWEVHARKETVHGQTGLVLVANASKLQGGEEERDPVEVALAVPPLQHALQGFAQSALDIESAVEDFVTAYGAEDVAALKEHLAAVAPRPGAGWREGFEAVAFAVKAQEALAKEQRIELLPGVFELGS